MKHAVTVFSGTGTDALPIAPRLASARWPKLYVLGSAGALVPPLVALVGTRNADPAALATTRALALALASRDACVLSGGALGIDAAAHTAALEAGARTVVVMPSGLSKPYPLRHRAMYRRIVEQGGALVSPFPPQTPPAIWTFPRRNELLASLCDLLVVVQAPRSSGALLTAEAARALGRRVLAVPASPEDPRGGGCLALLRMGAELCTGPDDLLAALERPDGPLMAADFARTRAPVRERPARARDATCARESTARSTLQRVPVHARAHTGARVEEPEPGPAREATRAMIAGTHEPPPSLDGDAALVYDELRSTPLHVDELVSTTSLPAARVRVALLQLVLAQLAHDAGDGRYARAARRL